MARTPHQPDLSRAFAPRARRRAAAIARALLVAFVLMQWAIPAFACVQFAGHLRAVTAAHAAGAEDCGEHASTASLLCFKHCHPDDGSSGSPVVAVPAMAPAPTVAPALAGASAGGVQRQLLPPGLPPPPTLSYCRLQR